MNLYLIFYRLRWMHAPVAILTMLLQRTPVLRLVTSGSVANLAPQSGDLLKSAFALAALGAYNSVAGATTFNATVVSPTTVTPTSGSAGTTFTANGNQDAAFSVSFNVTGAPGTSKSWKVAGTLPTGLSVTGGSAVTGGYVFNGTTKVTLAGTPTAAANQTLTFTAYDSTGATGNNAKVTCAIKIVSTAAAPAFTTQPTTQTVTTGNSASFTVAVTGTPTPTLQWYKDNVALSGQTGTTLTLANVQDTNAGSYTVVATNASAPSGVTSNAATLTVNPAPIAPAFTTQPAAQTVTVGDAVSFTVAVTGTPTPTLQWYKDNSALSGQTDTTLSLANVQSANAGTYKVIATNTGAPSGVSSNAVALTVNPAPAAPAFNTQPSTQTVTAGNSASFTVAVSGWPTPTLQWFKDDAPLSGETGTTLALANVQDTNAGSYTVVATNASAPSGVTSNAATLTVNPAPVAPAFTTQPAAQTITVGDAVSFTVAVTGTPTPTLQWYKDNAPLSGETGTTLSLANVQSGGAGTYKVVATNSAAPSGVSSTAVALTVNPAPAAPAFTTHPSTQTITAGNSASFTVAVSGWPTPTLQWFKDDAPLSGQTGTTLSLANVQDTNAGSYTAVATNDSAPSGVTSNAATLTVNPVPTAPVFTTQFATQAVNIGSTVTLTVTASGYPAPTFQWFKATTALAGQTASSLSLANFQASDAGAYSVKAFNASAPSGVASSVATLTAQVPPPAVVTAARTFDVGERLSFDLTGGTTYPAGITFAAAKIPAGLKLDAVTGQLTGVLSAKPGIYTLTYWTVAGKLRSVVRSLVLTVQAFPSAMAGRFEALIEDTSIGAVAPLPLGKVELTVVTATGAFTGRLTNQDAKPYAFKGSLELTNDLTAGGATVTLARAAGLSPATYQLALSVSNTGELTATLSANASQVGSGTGARLASTASVATYTMIIREPTNLGTATSYPHGDGYISVTSTAAGVFSLKGKLGDGTALTATTALGSDNVLRPYAKPYKPGGYFAGALPLTTRDDNSALLHLTGAHGSDLYWTKPAIATTAYPGGFGPLAVQAVMEPWNATPSTAFGPRLGLANDGNFTVTVLGDFQTNTGDTANAALPTTLNLSAVNVFTVVGVNTSTWTLKLTAKTGVFTGTCNPTDLLATHKATIEGVLLQPAPGDTLIGGGYLLAPAQNGAQTTSTSSVEFELAQP